MPSGLRFPIAPQPDGSSCGPTCLESIYRWYGDAVPVDKIIDEVPQLKTGGTLGVQLACHALRRGYSVDLYSFNLLMFDPTWFSNRATDLRRKLLAQKAFKKQPKLRAASDAYLEFLRLGGRLDMCEPSPRFIAQLLETGGPTIVGLSSTWLYGGPREIGSKEPVDDDVRGVPQGHFVVLCGWVDSTQQVLVADPYRPNPFSSQPVYPVDAAHLIASILLGIVTYDANLVLIRPPAERDPS